MADDAYDSFVADHGRFVAELGDVKVRDVVEPLMQLQHTDANLAHELWVTLFPLFWSATPREDRAELERGLVALLTKDYHTRQLDKRPAWISLDDGLTRIECRVLDVSPGGAKIVTEAAIDVRDVFTLALLPDRPKRQPCEVVWRRGQTYGIKFVN